jgi:hypothetical protein
MFRDIIGQLVEIAGPFAVKVLAAAATLAVFLPLLVAFVAPLLG